MERGETESREQSRAAASSRSLARSSIKGGEKGMHNRRKWQKREREAEKGK